MLGNGDTEGCSSLPPSLVAEETRPAGAEGHAALSGLGMSGIRLGSQRLLLAAGLAGHGGCPLNKLSFTQKPSFPSLLPPTPFHSGGLPLSPSPSHPACCEEVWPAAGGFRGPRSQGQGGSGLLPWLLLQPLP